MFSQITKLRLHKTDVVVELRIIKLRALCLGFRKKKKKIKALNVKLLQGTSISEERHRQQASS